MSQTIKTTLPDKPISGASLMKDSISGRKNQFIASSSTGSVPITIAAGAVASISFDLGLWSTSLPNYVKNSKNIVDWDHCVAWPYFDVYIDVDNVGANYYGSNSLTLDQSYVNVNIMSKRSVPTYFGSVGYSHSVLVVISNYGGLSHTVYFHGIYKYIIFGDQNL